MKISIIGTGVVGRATGRALRGLGHEVLFYDPDPAAFERMSKERCSTSFERAFNFGRILMLCVPTPEGTYGQADLSIYQGVIDQIGEEFRRTEYDKTKTIVQKSTCPPGTAARMISRLETEHSLIHGLDFYYLVNPEFLNSGRAEEDAADPVKIVVGIGHSSEPMLARRIYAKMLDRLYLLTYAGAEFTKYCQNIFHALLISAWNELQLVAERYGEIHDEYIYMDRIARLVAMEPGLESIYRLFGKAWGGACLPKDTRAFQTFARDLGASIPILDGVIRVNEVMKNTRGVRTEHWDELFSDSDCCED